jgi:hypothetical protein
MHGGQQASVAIGQCSDGTVTPERAERSSRAEEEEGLGVRKGEGVRGVEPRQAAKRPRLVDESLDDAEVVGGRGRGTEKTLEPRRKQEEDNEKESESEPGGGNEWIEIDSEDSNDDDERFFDEEPEEED